MILLPEILGQTYKSELDESNGKTPNPKETQRDVESKHQGIEFKKKYDQIRRLNKKWQANAKKVMKLEEEIRQKDQEIERVQKILDNHTFDSKSKQNPVSVVSAKQVYMVKTFNDRNPYCILIWIH